MPTDTSHTTKVLLCWIAILLSFTSCDSFINEDYDLSKDIDKTVSLLPGVSVPVGDGKGVLLSDVLKLEITDHETILEDENGNLMLRFEDEISFRIKTDQFDYSFFLPDGQRFESFAIDFPLHYIDVPEEESQEQVFSYTELTGSPLSVSTSMHFESDLSNAVKDIRYMRFDDYITIDFDAEAKVYLESGFKIIFPDCFVLNNHGQHPEYIISNEQPNIIELTDDMPVPGQLRVVVVSMRVPEGSFSDGRLNMDLDVRFEGDMYVRGEDVAGITYNPQIVVSLKDYRFKSYISELKIDYEYEYDDVEIAIDAVPDFLSSDAFSIDICNPLLYLRLDNTSYFSFDIRGAITAQHSTSSPSIYFGTDPRIYIAEDTYFNRIVFSSLPVEDNVESLNIIDPAFREMFRNLPKKLSFDDVKFRLSDDYFTVWHKTTSFLRIESRLELPLAFGDEVNFEYTYDVDIEEVDFDSVADEIVLNLDVVNSIPLSFDIEVQALDIEGYPIDWLKFDVADKVASGCQQAPVTTHLGMSIKTERDYIKFSGLRYIITASAPSSDHVGVQLNTNQKLEFNNIILNFPDGITIDLDTL